MQMNSNIKEFKNLSVEKKTLLIAVESVFFPQKDLQII